MKREFNLNITEDATISNIIHELYAQISYQKKLLAEHRFRKKTENNGDKELNKKFKDKIKRVDTATNIELESIDIVDERIDLNTDREFIDFKEEIIMENNDLTEESFKLKELSIKNLSKKIQQLYYILAAEKAKLFTYPVFLPYYYDFRGRIYPKSIIGFTYLKVLRAIFQLPGHNKEVDWQNLKESTYFQQILNTNIRIDDRLIKSKLIDVNKYFLTIHLLELGKYNKGKLAATNGLTLQNLIDSGVELYFNMENADIDMDDLVYMKIISDNISNFLNNNKFENITIIRDSTASFLQHWGIKLGVKDEYLNKLNLHGDI
jgi:hypothetical protein